MTAPNRLHELAVVNPASPLLRAVTNRVGMPVAEQMLVDVVVENRLKLFSPGSGRSVYVFEEVRNERGRADAVFLIASPQAARRHLEHGPRFANETECRVAAWLVEGWSHRAPYIARTLGMSTSYAASLIKELSQRGVTAQAVHQASTVVVHGSVVEAKVLNWRSALGQAIRYASSFDEASIALPENVAAKVDRDLVRRAGVGIIGCSTDRASWIRRPALKQSSPLWARVWMAELLARHYRFSSSLNCRSAASALSSRLT